MGPENRTYVPLVKDGEVVEGKFKTIFERPEMKDEQWDEETTVYLNEEGEKVDAKTPFTKAKLLRDYYVAQADADDNTLDLWKAYWCALHRADVGE